MGKKRKKKARLREVEEECLDEDYIEGEEVGEYMCSEHRGVNAWQRMTDGTQPQIDVQIYYKCIIVFIILYVYLVTGGVFLWLIEIPKSENDAGSKNVRRYPPKRYGVNSKTWKLFDAVFMCFAVASTSGTHSDFDNEIDTDLGLVYLILYITFGCPIVYLEISYMRVILTVWIHALVTFSVNSIGVFLSVFGRRPRLLRLRTAVEEMYQTKLSFPVAFGFTIIYSVVGSWVFFSNEFSEMVDLVYGSYSAFATVEVGKVFHVSSRGFVYLVYVLIGMALFQICMEILELRLDKFLFEDD